jgi:adenosylhomocysteine nucleosidase
VATSAGGRGTGRIGVITGLRAEARCLQGLDVVVACSGARPERARAEAARLLGEGAAGLVSFGLAGGLARSLAAGDLVLPAAVALPDGRRVATDPAWHGRLVKAFGAAGMQWSEDTLAGSDRLVSSPAAKAVLRATREACAVDMESHAVAALAAAAGVPFLVVRAIADPSHRAIPRVAQNALGPDGALRVAAVLQGLLRQPQELAGLLRLGRDSGRGFATLRRVAALAGPGLAFR